MARRAWPAVAWTIVVLVAVLIPGRWIHEKTSVNLGILGADKIAHFTLFAGYGLFWLRAAPTQRGLRCIGAVGVALAVLTELTQGLPVIDRDPDVFDALADVVGMICGLGVYRAVHGPLERGG